MAPPTSRTKIRRQISPRGLWLPTQLTTPVVLPVHAGYEFTLPAIPAPALEESLSEKLAAWRRRRKLRDLYDLNLFGRGSLNEPLIRRLLVLKPLKIHLSEHEAVRTPSGDVVRRDRGL